MTQRGPVVYDKAKYHYDGNYPNDLPPEQAFELLRGNLPSVYHVANTWANYDRLRERVDQRYTKWQRKRTAKPWQFWR